MLIWDDRYKTGHWVLDNDHREIFNRFNEIAEAIRYERADRVFTLVDGLHTYAREHFLRERHLAAACNACPEARSRNCIAHEQFLERLARWLRLLNSPPVEKSVLVEIHTEAARWIANHILKVDKLLVSEASEVVKQNKV